MQMCVRRSALAVVGAALLLGAHVALSQLDTPVTLNAETVPHTPTPAPTLNWVILPTLPAGAAQADYGAQIFRLACSPCHGDRGQGLTDEWRATWVADHQNCWQPNCHGVSHPPDGYQLPRRVPAVIGPDALERFETALELYEYNRTSMPWQNPGGMSDEKEWQVTAFLLRENGVDLPQATLNHETAARLWLHATFAAATQPSMPTPHPPPTAAAPQSEPQSTRIGSELWGIILVVLLCGAAALAIRLGFAR